MRIVSILGGSEIGQRAWRPGKKVWAISIFGGSEIDFRQAQLEEDVTQMTAISVFGGTEVIVPKDMPVTLSGFSILGGREVKRSQAKEPPPASAKALHINAISVFGGFELTEKSED